jgi:hypothetical protein
LSCVCDAVKNTYSSGGAATVLSAVARLSAQQRAQGKTLRASTLRRPNGPVDLHFVPCDQRVTAAVLSHPSVVDEAA